MSEAESDCLDALRRQPVLISGDFMASVASHILRKLRHVALCALPAFAQRGCRVRRLKRVSSDVSAALAPAPDPSKLGFEA